MQGHALERVLVPATHRDVSRRIADQGRSMCTVPRITHAIDHTVGAAGRRTAIRHATDEAASATIDLDVRQCGNMPTICSLLWRAYDASIDMIEAMIEEEKIACSFRRTASSSLLPSPRM
jgi:hypothetical protein